MNELVWADNADAVSMVYSGTGALKTDYTRTGKRTMAGNVQDGINSVVRYVKNNYMDGFRQDSIDVFLGNYRVRAGEPSPFNSLENNDAALRRKLVPSLMFLGLFMLFTSLAVPTESWTAKIFYILFWVIVVFFCRTTMLKNSGVYVDLPKLFDPVTGKKSASTHKD